MERHGFILETERELGEVDGRARLWRHKETGAELLSVCNSDENKCFGVSFCTPPKDSSGVAHILEHSVLCGSKKYPLKEPFVELLKGSLQTFLNAFTFPDKTCYPVASTNLQDLYNLIDVYLDAVFHPRLGENIFRQEGWHVEAPGTDAPWSFRGVVYNEMKGVYSSPDSVLAEKSQQALFPDNLYSLDSGGRPDCILGLDYDAFCAFHKRYYHPGNARFFFWGDDPEERRLERIAAELTGYGKDAEKPVVPLQKPLDAPRQLEVKYAADPGEDRALFTLNWLLAERGDVREALRMEMLEHILEGLPGSPLRKALISSGLGEDTTGCGLETDLRQMYYSTGLKGLNPRDIEKAEALILKTLEDLALKGIDQRAVEAAVNSVEFSLRENNFGRFPKGLCAMIQALSTWNYGGDPLAPLAWEAPLAEIKSALGRGEKVFEQIIREKFLDNPHRVRVDLLPDPALGVKLAEAEEARLEKLRAEAGANGQVALIKATRELEAAQDAPDSPEALATIPALGLGDLPRLNKEIPLKASPLDAEQTFLGHELATNGIAYVNLLLPIERLPEKLWPYLPLYARALTEAGTARHDFSALGENIAAKTGGIGASALSGLSFSKREAFCYLVIGGKAVADKIPDLFGLYREILLEPLRDPARLRERLGQMLLEDKARLEYGLLASGHATISSRLRAHFSPEAALAERLGGITYLEDLRSLILRLNHEPEAFLADFAELGEHLLASSGAVFDATGDSEILARVESHARELLGGLPAKARLASGAAVSGLGPLVALPRHEAILASSQVNYVGKAANLFELGYDWHGSAAVILRWLRMGRLWEEVRVRGGAYGAFCSADRLSGTLVCASYRDPNVVETLDVYDSLGGWLKAFKPSPAQIEQAIVGSIGDLDTYLLPDAKGAKALAQWLSGSKAEERQRIREEILSTSARDFQDFAGVLESALKGGASCVLGGASAEEAAKKHSWATRRLL